MKTEQDLKNTFARHIKTRRVGMGWTQEKLAEKVGVTKNTISDIETGDKFARADTLVRLARVFETQVYELLKPKNIQPDNTKDVITKYSEEVREAVERVGKSYLSGKKNTY
jgi:repressor LexA